MAVISSSLEKTVKVTGRIEFSDFSNDSVKIELTPKGNITIFMKTPGTVLLEKEDVAFLRNVLNGDI